MTDPRSQTDYNNNIQKKSNNNIITLKYLQYRVKK